MTTAYNRIDRFLRKHLNDDNYLSYKDELDAICQAKIQRTWQGLTDDEVRQMCGSVPSMKEAVREAESKLKEKNNV